MKKNNKYRSNNNNNHNNYSSQVYSLNYKFDSISAAGKICGTALDLIKRYNELAKEAQGNTDYVEAENFRQYAEHYRKIVTEINERKNQYSNTNNKENPAPVQEANANPSAPVADVSTSAEASNDVVLTESKNQIRKRTFKVIDISPNQDETDQAVVTTVKRNVRPRVTKEKTTTEPAAI